MLDHFVMSTKQILVGFLILITVIDITFIIFREKIARKRERKHMDEIAVVAYNHDKDFKDYVDKYMKANDLSMEEAFDHKIVKLYLNYTEHKND